VDSIVAGGKFGPANCAVGSGGKGKISVDALDTTLMSNAKKASEFLKVMANENRLIILCALAQGEKNVGELEDILGIRQPTLSQQLSRLRSENVVVTRRESKQIYYRIASDEVIELIGLMYDLFCNKEMDASATAEVSANVA
jgi:DNA-binding transcriptional ArsR family regulator